MCCYRCYIFILTIFDIICSIVVQIACMRACVEPVITIWVFQFSLEGILIFGSINIRRYMSDASICMLR